MTATNKVRFEWRRNTADGWTSDNPVLLDGEPGWESDDNKIKVGDGSTAWNDLAYFSSGGAFLPLSGGVMSGTLDMNTNSIINLEEAGENGRPVEYAQWTSINTYLEGLISSCVAQTGSTMSGDLTIFDGAQLIVNDGSGALMRMGQKNNGEIVWSYNVDQNNGDALDDPSDSAFKFSIQGVGGGGYNGLHVQYTPANTGSWNGQTLFTLNGSDGSVQLEGDLLFSANDGPILIDKSDGHTYRIISTAGVLSTQEVT